MAKVSIIIPIYNSEKTIINCLKGLLIQNLNDIEIICVDDCSSDNTYMMLELIEKQYPEKIILIKNDKNRGPGGARNTGMMYASGEYIGFVDSDDEVAFDMYKKLYDVAISIPQGYDMVECGFYREGTDTTILYAEDSLCGELDSAKRNELIARGGYVYTKIYKKSFLDNIGIVFRENIALEDAEFVAYTYATAKNIANVKEALYYYKNTDNSLSKQKNHMKNYYACVEAMNALYDRLGKLEYYDEIRCSVEYFMVQLYIYAIISILSWYKLEKRQRAEDTLMYLKELLDNRNIIITISYDKNKFIKEKIKREDVQLAEANDVSPENLLEII